MWAYYLSNTKYIFLQMPLHYIFLDSLCYLQGIYETIKSCYRKNNDNFVKCRSYKNLRAHVNKMFRMCLTVLKVQIPIHL
jgi:hypothetical protein